MPLDPFKVEEWRLARGMTRAQLADAMGVHLSYLDRLVNRSGRRISPTIETVEKMTHALRVQVQDLISPEAVIESKMGNWDGRPATHTKLTESEVKRIWSSIQAGEPLTELAKRFDVHLATISNIATGRTWRHITGMSAPVPPEIPRPRRKWDRDEIIRRLQSMSQCNVDMSSDSGFYAAACRLFGSMKAACSKAAVPAPKRGSRKSTVDQ